jgi:ribosomal protein L35
LFDRVIATGGVKRLSSQRRHEIGARKSGLARRRFAKSQYLSANTASRMARLGKHRANPGRIPGRVEPTGIAKCTTMVTTVERGAVAPATTADEAFAIENQEVGAVID